MIGLVRVLFTSSIPHLPQIYGGLNTHTHEFCLELIKRGHQPSVLTRLSYGNSFGVRTLLRDRTRGRRLSVDHDLGYPVFRARKPWTMVHAIPRPDAAILQDGRLPQYAAALSGLGVPAIGYFHGLDFEDWTFDGRPAQTADLPPIEYFANSEYTAGRFSRRYRMAAHIVPPIFRSELYRTERAGRNAVFINPVREKGVDLALAVAALCPEIPFLFVKGWPLDVDSRWRLLRRLWRLPNVRLLERRTNMREIFRNCHVLLVPSQRESWGRVASEAHFSGIPVIGSDIGGLPEAIGPGGLIIDPGAPPEVWAAALRQLWFDDELYQTKSCAAQTYSQRPQLNTERQLDLLLAGLARAAAASRKTSSIAPAREVTRA